MAITVVIWNSKGGSTKTSSLLECATELSLLGKRVLMVDLDYNNPALTFVLMTAGEMEDLTPAMTSARFFTNPRAGVTKLVRTADIAFDARDLDGRPYYPTQELERVKAHREWRPGEGLLDIIPGAMRPLSAAIRKLERAADRGEVDPTQAKATLQTALAGAQASYDYIFLDAPPALPDDSFGLACELWAATHVLIPLPMEQVTFLAAREDLEAVALQNEEFAQRGLKRQLQILGVLPTRYRDGLKSHRTLRAKCERSPLFAPYLFRTLVPEDSACIDAQDANLPVQLMAPHSAVAGAVAAFTREVVERAHAPSPIVN